MEEAKKRKSLADMVVTCPQTPYVTPVQALTLGICSRKLEMTTPAATNYKYLHKHPSFYAEHQTLQLVTHQIKNSNYQ